MPISPCPIYLWMGGVDGLYGTVYRWVKTLKSWNPGLAEDRLFRLVYRLFDFALPEVACLADICRYIELDFADTVRLTHLGEPFPEAFSPM